MSGLTQQQIEARLGRITSTTLAPVLGLECFTSELEAQLEILGEAPEKKDTPKMQWGRALERYMGDEHIASRVVHPARLVRGIGTISSTKYPWLAVSPDGIEIEGIEQDYDSYGLSTDIRIALEEGGDGPFLWTVTGGWEGKVHVPDNRWALEYWLEQWDGGRTPTWMRAQCDAMILGTGAPHWDLNAFVPTMGIVERRIERDDEHLANIVEHCADWHERHIIRREPVTPGPKDLDLVKRMFPESLEQELVADPGTNIDRAVHRYADARRRRLAAEKEEKQAQAEILATMGESVVLAGESYRVTTRRSKGSRFLSKGELEKVVPGIVERCTRIRPGSRKFDPRGELFAAKEV